MKTDETVFGYGSNDKTKLLTDHEIYRILSDAFSAYPLRGKKILLVIPDGTRTMQMDRFFKTIYSLLHGVVKQLDLIIALGTHRPMSEKEICARLGLTVDEYQKNYRDVHFYNHTWDDPSAFLKIGEFDPGVFKNISLGTIDQSIPVEINKIILNYDVLMVCGPVFPHEVVGFSGGSKYFFPGIGAPALIDATHWTAAVQSCRKTIGIIRTPNRELIETAATWIPLPRIYCCAVVKKEGIYGLFAGDPCHSWQKAAALSAEVHIVYKDKPFHTVLAEIPPIYEDIWTAGKGMFKLEQVVQDGGELILYAPHIRSISKTHGKILESIGYHCRDYYLKQWNNYKMIPWSVLSHSVNVSGPGTYENGIETKRISVRLATGIPEAHCKKINLKYENPKNIRPEAYKNREDEGILSVPYAGETLYRIFGQPSEI